MKKLLFGLIATVLLTSVSYGQVKSEAQKIHIEFGRKSKNCEGFGICVFTIDLEISDAIAIINALRLSDGTIKTIMSPEFYKMHSNAIENGYLVVEEDYTIDPPTTRALGVADNYTIKSGKYKVVFDKTTNTYNCTF